MGKRTSVLLRNLPSVDRLLGDDELQNAIEVYGRETVTEAVREVLSVARNEINAGNTATAEMLDQPDISAQLCGKVLSLLEKTNEPSIKPVFNLTGTVIHTNLGRAELPETALREVVKSASSAVNLEFDLDSGTRSKRENHVSGLICELTGAKAATVVNNNAAAVVLVLTTLAVGREVLISRGELVEIGGAFRIPEVMGSAGCRLKEVGATNRTHAKDFEKGIDENSALIMKVHTSNYEIQGFTKTVPEIELAKIAHAWKLPFVVDLGSGTLVDLKQFGLPAEPTVRKTLEQGADIVTFSGDKLLGGPQAGIIVGEPALIEQINSNPLKRALRVDKMTLAALGAVLSLYKSPSRLRYSLPILRDLTRSLAEIRKVADLVFPIVSECLQDVGVVSVIATRSQIGSGALPVDRLDSLALAIEVVKSQHGGTVRLEDLARKFRTLPRPVIGRINSGRLIFDLRCLHDTSTFCQQLQDADWH